MKELEEKKRKNPMKPGASCYNRTGTLYLALGENYLWMPRTETIPSRFSLGNLYPDPEFWATLEGEEWTE